MVGWYADGAEWQRLERFCESKSAAALDFGGLRIGYSILNAAFQVMRETGRVKHLGLRDCQIDDDTGRQVAAMLSEDGMLESIDLAANYLTGKGVGALCTAMGGHSKLELIDMSGNPLGDEGARLIASAVRQNRLIRSLSLEATGIGDRGAKELASAIGNNAGIEKVFLGGCPIGQRGVAAVARVVADRQDLTVIGLRNFNETVGRERLDRYRRDVRAGHAVCQR